MAATTKCVEMVSRGAWSRHSQCQRSAGFGKDGAYCKQHSAAHMDDVAAIATWYRVIDEDYRCEIVAVKVIEEQKSALIIKDEYSKSYREPKVTKYHIYLPTRAAAIEHYRSKVRALRAKADKLEREIDAEEGK